MNQRWRCWLLLALCGCSGRALWAQAPEFTGHTPGALAAGGSTHVTLTGKNLAGAVGLWLGFPGKAELAPGIDKNGQDPAKVVYRIQVPAETPVGIYPLRVATDKGISNYRLCVVDDLPTVADNGANPSPAAAQALTLPTGVEGACEAEAFDIYKFTGKKGERVSVEVLARRLGSALDPVVRLRDAQGKELAYCDDEPALFGDARLAVVLPADGEYFVELRDIRYTGGAGHVYRLRVGNFPLASTAYPLAATKGKATKLGFVGLGAEGVAEIDVTVPATATGDTFFLGVKRPDGRGASFVTVGVTDLDVVREQEPNNAPEQATALTLPIAVGGRFEAAKDRDFFQFQGKKGDRLLISGRTRQFGSPTDLYLRLYNDKGAAVAEADDSGPAEGAINVTLPEDGAYRLMAEHLNRVGGPDQAYLLEIRPYRPGFSLAVEIDRVNPPQGGVFTAKVTAARQDYAGPIALEIEGLPAGVKLEGQTIEMAKNDTVLRATLPDAIAPGTLGEWRVVGVATINEQPVRVTASNLAALKKASPAVVYYPPRIEGSLGFGVGPVFPPFFALATEPAELVLPRLVGKATFKVKSTRMNNFAEAITLALEGLPPEITAKVAPIAKGQNEVAIELTGPGDLPEKEFKVRLSGAGVHQDQPKSVALENVSLRVIPPLQVAFAAAGPLPAGGKQKAKLTVTRFGDDKQPVAVSLKNLPAGVAAPANLMIPGDKNELEIELTAAADAAVGKAENIVASAATKVQNQDVTVDSKPAPLEVAKAP